MKVNPIGVLGADISEIMLIDINDHSSASEIKKLIDKYKVLFFKEQHLTGDELIKLSNYFGDPFVQPALSDKFQDLLIIETNEEKPPYLDTFHQDMTGLSQPPALFFLEGVVIPEVGGDTIWSCNQSAYDSLSPIVKEFLLSLTCTHSLLHYYESIFARWKNGHEKKLEFQKHFPPVSHPLIRTHPNTGKKGLFVNKFFTESINDISKEESENLLQFLFEIIEKPEFCVRLKWSPGTIAIWDNRCTSHYAVADYYPETRILQRAAIAGETVF